MKKLTVLFLVLMLLVPAAFVVAGGKQETPTEGMEEVRDSEYSYYVVTHGGPGDPWWGGTFNNGIEAAQEYFSGTEIQWLGPDTYSVQEQVDMLNTAIDAEPDGLVVTIPDVKAFDEPLRRAHDMGIPIITVNVTDDRDPMERIPYLCYVGGDEYEQGYQSGIRMMQEFDGEKPERAVVLIHQPGHAGLELRAEGFADAMEGVEVEKLAGTSNEPENYQALEAFLTRNEDTEVVFTLGPLGAHPTIQLFDDEDYWDDIKFGTIDLSDDIISSIEDGKMVFGTDQQAWLQAFLPIGLLNLYNDFGLVPSGTILTGPDMVDESNVDMAREGVEKGWR
ncbi:MAG: substrate-binding domain-containing protein [Spirochaetaceae bacterium]